MGRQRLLEMMMMTTRKKRARKKRARTKVRTKKMMKSQKVTTRKRLYKLTTMVTCSLMEQPFGRGFSAVPDSSWFKQATLFSLKRGLTQTGVVVETPKRARKGSFFAIVFI
jgi:hypothetical protein